MKHILVTLLLIATSCYAYDRESAALQILSGKPVGSENCFTDTNGDGVRDGTTAGIDMAAIWAITNRADVVALCQQMDAAKAAAEKATVDAEDTRIAKLPSVAAIVAENADLRKKLDAAEAKLAIVQATADKAAADVATLKAVPKTVEPVPK
jgi:hypothetical protein